MKTTLLALLLLFTMLHAPGQDLTAQDDMLKKRADTVQKLHELMNNPATSPDLKLKLAAAALDLLDQDTQLLAADHDLIAAAKKALDDKNAADAANPPPAPQPVHHNQPPDARVSPLPAN